MKKKLIRIVTILLLAALTGKYIYVRYIREQNVFDQMYYTRSYDDNHLSRPANFRGRFENMEQMKSRKGDHETADWGIFRESYKPEYLEPGAELEIFISNGGDRKHVTITYVTEDPQDSETGKWYKYYYNIDTRTLTYITNDPDNTGNRKNFLYDILLKDYFEANQDSRFSLNKLGTYTEVEMTPEEYWKSIGIED